MPAYDCSTLVLYTVSLYRQTRDLKDETVKIIASGVAVIVRRARFGMFEEKSTQTPKAFERQVSSGHRRYCTCITSPMPRWPRGPVEERSVG